jgi:prephenate dehydrogenase
MKICILGVGKIGTWLARTLASDHEIYVFDVDTRAYRNLPGVNILSEVRQVSEVAPHLLINSVSLEDTVPCFRDVAPYLAADCLLCDVASVKGELPGFYRESGFRFVSLHPMFGPTFAHLHDIRDENVVIISDSDIHGKEFFRCFFMNLGSTIFEYSFREHDAMMAYSLTLPFVSSLVFSSCVTTGVVPGTTFKRHLEVSRGLLAEDDFLLAEILFNPHSLAQLEKISGRLNFLWHIIKNRDLDEARRLFDVLRNNIRPSAIHTEGQEGEKHPETVI